MLLVHKANSNRLDLEVGGPLDAEMMKLGLEDLFQKSEGMSGGQMLIKIADFAMPTFGAVMIEMARFPSLFNAMHKFDKCAVLTDANWMQTAAKLEGALMPSLEIKAFDCKDTLAAEAWLTGVAAMQEEDDDPMDNMPV
ncbi:MAG: STAS/SEC14 domain-containing protein [Octadecabacter sp.]